MTTKNYKQVKEKIKNSGIAEIRATYHAQSKAVHKIENSTDAKEYFLQNWEPGTLDLNESFYCMHLNRANKVKGIHLISTGGITGTVVDIQILIATALITLSKAIIIAHNHPSGNIYPGAQDKSITKRIKDASELMDIKLLDHIIVNSDQEYFSFADEGLI